MLDRNGESSIDERSCGQSLSRKPAAIALSRYTRMMVYKYLKLDDLLSTISRLSNAERSSLKNSHIINKNRHWMCNLWHKNVTETRHCLLHKDRILHKFNRIGFLLSLVDIVNIRIDPSQISDKVRSST